MVHVKDMLHWPCAKTAAVRGVADLSPHSRPGQRGKKVCQAALCGSLTLNHQPCREHRAETFHAKAPC